MTGQRVDAKTGAGDLPPFVAPAWDLGRRVLQPAGRPLVMGVINLTPDSFYPASRQDEPQTALAAARAMIAAGADVLDLGAESSRPGARPVATSDQQDRLLPVLAALRAESDVPVTVDTTSATTARAAIEAGADAINDISAGTDDGGMLPLVAEAGCGLALMHMRGTPRTMQEDPCYEDVVAEVRRHLTGRAAAAEQAGVPASRILVDPGIGFGKLLPHNLSLLAALKTVADGRPLLVGASRKSFIGHLTGARVESRLPGSLAALAAAFFGGATVVRVHDVAESVQFLETLAAIVHGGEADLVEATGP